MNPRVTVNAPPPPPEATFTIELSASAARLLAHLLGSESTDVLGGVDLYRPLREALIEARVIDPGCIPHRGNRP
jgi:hypothetical protein